MARSGPQAGGAFVQTLVLIGIASGWRERAPLLFREKRPFGEVMTEVREGRPVPLLGFDTDNDRAVMNETIKAWCEAAGAEFTRSRPYRKNGQAHIEHENGAVARRMVGYREPEGLAAAEALARLDRPMRLFANFFQPSFKIAKKHRKGALVRKRHHPPLTPHPRLVANPRAPPTPKEALDARHAELDPVRRLGEIRAAQQALARIADKGPGVRRDGGRRRTRPRGLPRRPAPGLDGGRGPTDRAADGVQAARTMAAQPAEGRHRRA